MWNLTSYLVAQERCQDSCRKTAPTTERGAPPEETPFSLRGKKGDWAAAEEEEEEKKKIQFYFLPFPSARRYCQEKYMRETRMVQGREEGIKEQFTFRRLPSPRR